MPQTETKNKYVYGAYIKALFVSELKKKFYLTSFQGQYDTKQDIRYVKVNR